MAEGEGKFHQEGEKPESPGKHVKTLAVSGFGQHLKEKDKREEKKKMTIF